MVDVAVVAAAPGLLGLVEQRQRLLTILTIGGSHGLLYRSQEAVPLLVGIPTPPVWQRQLLDDLGVDVGEIARRDPVLAQKRIQIRDPLAVDTEADAALIDEIVREARGVIPALCIDCFADPPVG